VWSSLHLPYANHVRVKIDKDAKIIKYSLIIINELPRKADISIIYPAIKIASIITNNFSICFKLSRIWISQI
jgi:hypothetical protein